MFTRPTILCRRSSRGAHDFVVALPDGSREQAAERFATALGIESYRRLSGNRIAFGLREGPVLDRLVRAAFAGRLGGYPVLRALVHPGMFPDETDGREMGQPSATDNARREPRPEPTAPRGQRLGPAVAVMVSFLLGVIACGVLQQPGPGEAGARAGVPAAVEEVPSSTPADLGTFVAALGPAAAFRSEDGSLRYAVAGGSLEGRVKPGTEVRVGPGVRPAIFTPVHALRDPDGTFIFDRAPVLEEPPSLEQYEDLPDEVLGVDLAWQSAEDSTRSFYTLRTGWRRLASRPLRLEGAWEKTDAGILLRIGSVGVRLTGMDEIDRINLSMGAPRGSGTTVYGTVAEALPWETLRFGPGHEGVCIRVDWIDPGLPGPVCRAGGI